MQTADEPEVFRIAAEPPGEVIAINVEDLVRHYQRGKVEAIRGVSFAVRKGRVFGLIGPDGAGKTSLMQILAGVLSASGGRAEVAGIDVLNQPERVKPLIGYMPQGLGLNLYDSLTVAENIEFFRDLRQVPEAIYRENSERLLAMTRLAPFLDRPAGNLSGGMRQKLALICTLIHLPDILLLDEPTTGVDPLSRRDFWTIIHDLVATRGITVLLTTAYMDEAERCHWVALMHEGTLIGEGAPEALTVNLPGRLVALHGAAPRKIINALNGWSGMKSVALFGSEVHVLLADGTQNLAGKLSASGLGDVVVREIPAGLEDVFVHRMTNANTDDSPVVPTVDSTQPVTVNRDEAMIDVDGLSCRFGDFVAVDAVRFSVRTGEIFGLLGPNGAGKTTLIRMLCGLQSPTGGNGRVGAFDVHTDREGLRSRIGYMSQRFSLYRDLRVWDNVELYAGLYGLPSVEGKRRGAQLLDRLGLAPYRNRLTGSLPLGLRQRLALACAQLHAPPVLFLDEPTSGVDPLARRQFWDIVHLLAQEQGVTVLVSTHYMDEAEHCDRLGLMQAGRLVAAGEPASLKQQAQDRQGPTVVVQAPCFAEAFHVLRPHFPAAMLYGRRIQWQSMTSCADQDKARRLLATAGIEGQVAQQALTMEETFVSFMESGG